ncbi:MAG TPA: catalase, partial [Saprospiraceae bacterium]|nr:catalase [Saprospiraceae bacterium]
AFNPANVAPGIGFSPDRMLQARLFSYGDAQRYRLGVNHYQIPVNKPQCPFHNASRDGAMRVDGNEGGTLHYFPNSYNQWEEQKEFTEPALSLEGDADHYDFREDDDDYYSQPGNLFRKMNDTQKQLLFKNTAAEVGGAERFIQERHIANCYKADPDYGKGVADALGIAIEDVLNK